MVTGKETAEGFNNFVNDALKISKWKFFWWRVKHLPSNIKDYKKYNSPTKKIIDITPKFFIEKNKEKLEELSKTCRFAEAELGPEGHKEKIKVMDWASPEYIKFYNKECIEAAMKFLKDCCIIKAEWKKHKKEIKLYLERPGVFVGPKGEFINYVQKALGVKIKLKEEQGINHEIGNLCYAMCANNWDDLL